MPGLLVLVRTELLKLGTTRAPWLLAGGALALTVLLALQPVTRAGRDGAPSIGTVGAALGVLDALGRGALVALLVGRPGGDIGVPAPDGRNLAPPDAEPDPARRSEVGGVQPGRAGARHRRPCSWCWRSAR